MKDFSEESIITKMNMYNLPQYMQKGVVNYLFHGLEPGDFLYSVLCNNLIESISNADASNFSMLRDWALFIYNNFPMDAWGSVEKVTKWIESFREEIS